jgi:hypothetical protein
MVGTRVSVDGLADAVMKGLEEYAKLSTDGMKEAVKKAGKDCKQEISANAPKRTSRYAKSWATKVTGEAANMLQVTVYSKEAWQPHLLEHGHAKRGGGRVPAQVHIAPAEENAEKELEQEIRKALEG